jgi:hypothetical protein
MTREELLEQFDILSTEYVRLLNDLDVLQHWGKPQLEALYLSKIGVFQIQLIAIQLDCKSLKRKLEKVRAAINKDLQPDFEQIEKDVEEELGVAYIALNQQMQDLENAKQMLGNLSSPTKSAELRKLYKEMAKKLHPDVNPELTKEQKELWLKVKDAYECGDLDRLKALKIIYEKELAQTDDIRNNLTTETLELKIAVLKESIKVLEQQITIIRSEFPFTLEKELKDDEWVANETATLKEELEAMQNQKVAFVEEYKMLKSLYE